MDQVGATPPEPPLVTTPSDAASTLAPPPVAIIMGSRSDWPTLRAAAEALDALGVRWTAKVISAHRTPDRMVAFAKAAGERGYRVIIAGAGGAAHLPGMTAALTELPVLGVPVQSKALNGLDSLLSIVQMPGGVPTATFAIGSSGAKNAGLFAAQVLALSDPVLARRLTAYRAAQTAAVEEAVDEATDRVGDGDIVSLDETAVRGTAQTSSAVR